MTRTQVDTAVEGIRQELGQIEKGMNRSVESIEKEVRTLSSALQAEKQVLFQNFRG
jgi:hypothetical protein